MLSSRLRLVSRLGRRQLSTSGELLGGYDRIDFINMVENVAPFTRNFLRVKVTEVAQGTITMVLPLSENFVGNPHMPCLHGGIAAAVIGTFLLRYCNFSFR
jgi:acyl-coenzyme A thioesterase PaaI-like protein